MAGFKFDNQVPPLFYFSRSAAHQEVFMARISKTDHPRILHLVDVDRRKVVEVAAEYGCTPANMAR